VKRTEIPRVGLLSSEYADSPWHAFFWEGMRELGWVEGQNLATERRNAQGQPDRFSEWINCLASAQWCC
jgi:hypothetical protein